MADEGNNSRRDTSEWADPPQASSTLEQRVESLAVEFQRFAMEMRREIRLLKGLTTPPATTPGGFGAAITVTTQCRTNFSIGKNFNCEVVCEVIDMDASHLILGRSWQFDHNVTYEGRANVYSLNWKGLQLRLLPMPRLQITPPESPAA